MTTIRCCVKNVRTIDRLFNSDNGLTNAVIFVDRDGISILSDDTHMDRAIRANADFYFFGNYSETK